MPFDITTARPVGKGKFDISTAKPIQERQPVSQEKFDPLIPKEAEVNKLISERTDPVETLRQEVTTPFDFKKHPFKSAVKPFVTTSKIAAIPFARASSAIGGLGLGLQKTKGFGESFKMAKEGLLGQKQFKAFDPARAIGVPGAVATVGELALEIGVSLKAMSAAGKILRGPIQRMNDKKLLEAGGKLVKSSDDAVKVVGNRLTKVYQPINGVKVDPTSILDDVVELPQPIIKHLERSVGKLDDYMQDFTIEKARELKRVLGELRPSAFGKIEKGAVELVTDKQINKAYGAIKQSMQKALKDNGLAKEAVKLLDADDAFSATKNASRLIKKTITDPTLRAPTKIGRAASGLEREADITFRQALNTLKKSGFSVTRDLNSAVSALESFNRLQKIQKFGGALGRSAIFGGIAGGTAGRIIGEF